MHGATDTGTMALCYFRSVSYEKLPEFAPQCNFVVLGFRGMGQKHVKNPKAINQTAN